MEFLRFGSHIPGRYWGCCAASIIQNFKVDPDEKFSSQIQYGDSGEACVNSETSKHIWAGPTYKDIFLTRLRIGEFGQEEMPNHAFFAILTDTQVNSAVGNKWLAILREAGFEFLRTVDNSVYTGKELLTEDSDTPPHKNYIFALFRNIGLGSVEDQFTPPDAWTSLPKVKEETFDWIKPTDLESGGYDLTALTKMHREVDLAIWNSGETKFLSEEEVEAAGAPVILMGLRDEDNPYARKAAFPPESKADRAANIKRRKEARAAAAAAPIIPATTIDPFAAV